MSFCLRFLHLILFYFYKLTPAAIVNPVKNLQSKSFLRTAVIMLLPLNKLEEFY